MLNYNHLYYFHVAALEGSVGAAAVKLGVTQPTVSEQLRSLERSLGTTLFERSPTGLRLSDTGRIAFERTSVMFREVDRLLRDLDRAGAVLPRQLRVGISGLVARSTSAHYLLPLLRLDAATQIKLGECNDLMKHLKNNTLDLVICEQAPPESERHDIDVTLLERTELVVVAAPKLEIAPDWKNVSLIQYNTGSRYRWDVDAFLDKRKLSPRIAAEADDALFLVEAAATGEFLAIVPSQIAKEPVSEGRIKVIETIASDLTAIYAMRRTTATSELVKRAVELLSR